MMTDFRLVQPSNNVPSNVFTLLGMVIVSKLVQSENIDHFNLERFSDNVTSFNAEQPEKAAPSVSVTLLGITIFVSFLHPLKLPIYVTVLGIVMDVSSSCPKKDCVGEKLVTVYSTPL